MRVRVYMRVYALQGVEDTKTLKFANVVVAQYLIARFTHFLGS